ncbi:MAG: GNAT family N-acetyltransferase [Candidatus Marinimicrobia bacterium]|nr:GNAT family N-acetyltransferase [Candidatus Neomarinimicrobiota bacterium]
MEIRKANEKDIDTIARFNINMALETENKSLHKEIITKGVETMIQNPCLGFYLMAEIDGKIAGSLMVTTEWSDWRNGFFWWIQSVYVEKEFRRQGVYSSLYHHVKKLSESEKVCGFRLYVEKENFIARKTYEKLGMSETHYRMYEEAK